MYTDKIQYIKYHHAYKYELYSIYTYETTIYKWEIDLKYIHLDPNGRLSIYAGYKWNGPSDPAFDTKNFMRGSLVHDALYQLMRMRKLSLEYRKYADKVLYDICRDAGMSRLRASWVYAAVRIGGTKSSKPGSQKQKSEILVAP